MSQHLSVWIVVLAALCAANLPFATRRVLGAVPLRKGKTLPIRLLELVVLYFVVGGIGLLLEQHAGQIAPQGWQFFAITGALFVTLAFPGFVYRYLLRGHD